MSGRKRHDSESQAKHVKVINPEDYDEDVSEEKQAKKPFELSDDHLIYEDGHSVKLISADCSERKTRKQNS